MTKSPLVCTEIEEVRQEIRRARNTSKVVNLVPTMGALHDGHLALVRAACSEPGSFTIVSIFVNPQQFGANEDFDKYPREIELDAQLLSNGDVDLVFAPTIQNMYPRGRRTVVHPGRAGEVLDGESRPILFPGMLTVVSKLFNICEPQRVFFGEKDFQQLVLVRQMVEDLDFDIEVIGVPTVRDLGGLALSSRNRYLTQGEASAAQAIHTALEAGRKRQVDGPDSVIAAARDVLSNVDNLTIEYLSITDYDLDCAQTGEPARLLIAVWVGETRLIDNCQITL